MPKMPTKTGHEYLKDLLDILYELDPKKFLVVSTTEAHYSSYDSLGRKTIDIHVELADG